MSQREREREKRSAVNNIYALQIINHHFDANVGVVRLQKTSTKINNNANNNLKEARVNRIEVEEGDEI